MINRGFILCLCNASFLICISCGKTKLGKSEKQVAIFFVILESMFLASSCSLDAFTASFAYGTKGVKIPFLSNQIINLICSSIFGISLWIGSAVRQYLPGWLTIGVAFTILFVIGLMKLLDSITKSIIRRHNQRNKDDLSREVKFTLFNFRFILNLYANPENADVNENKVISPAEAALLAVSLSLDGIAVGFGAALGNVNILAAFLISLVTDMLAVFVGCWLGNKLSRKLPFNMSWLSGVILMGLAVSKLF